MSTDLTARISLVDRVPDVLPGALVARFVPPRRFAAARFDTYVTNPAHPSQALAVEDLGRFAAGLGGAWQRQRRSRRARRSETAPGRYLDGAFGVGKTHLLAALWHAAPEQAAFLSFADLTATIGDLGMAAAVDAFTGFRLLCIDEFELDDVANTLMTVTFLRELIPGGTRVATTSNSLPDRLGEGRFHAADFAREIAAIASHFEPVRIDGPDYRAHAADPVATPGDDVVGGIVDRIVDQGAGGRGGTVSVDAFGGLLAHLRRVPVARFGALLDGLDAVVVHGMRPIENQGDALLWVHFVDKVYEAEVAFVASGAPIEALFPASYRHGGYRTKYGRAESRLAEMLRESVASDTPRDLM